jgi:electron transfer flavoprotein alpha subunit
MSRHKGALMRVFGTLPGPVGWRKSKKRNDMTTLIVAEHENGTLNPATRAAVSAAQQIGGDIHLLLLGEGIDALAEQCKCLSGVSQILYEDDAQYAHPLPEVMAPAIASVGNAYSHILMAATTTGKDIMPRAAALLDVQQISDIIAVVDADTFVRPIYAGNALETVKSSDAIKVITVRGTSFDKAGDDGSATITDIPAVPVETSSRFISLEGSGGERPDLPAARVVVSGGRGVGSGENFAIIEALADKLGAAVGASRAAVDAGYVPNDYQVGQTGKIVAPELYIAVGLSGAIQHLAGMKDSKVIVAINKDENAPIFDVADYGLVADLFEAVPELTEKL